MTATSDGRGQIFVSYLQIYCEVVSDLLIGQEQFDDDRNVVPGSGTGAGSGAGLGSGLGSGLNQPVSVSVPVPVAVSVSASSIPSMPYNLNHLSIRERAGSVFVEGLSRSRISSLSDLNSLLIRGEPVAKLSTHGDRRDDDP